MNNFAARCVERMDWDRRYQIGDIPWEKGAPAPPLLEWLQACGPLHGNILVPGCGYGHDVRAIAAAAPDANPWDEGEEPAGGGPPFGVSIAELDQLFGPVFDRIDEKHPRSSFPGREGREIIWLLRKR